MQGHVGWWPRHWKAWAPVLLPMWILFLFLIYPTLYLSRGLTCLWPGRAWRNWINDHVLLGGAILPWDPKALRQQGVGAVINLCAELRDPVKRLQELGMDHLDLPTLNRTAPCRESIRRGIEFLRDKQVRGIKTYVHCASGAGRSATLVACYLVDSGMTVEEALRHMKDRRPAVSLLESQREAVAHR